MMVYLRITFLFILFIIVLTVVWNYLVRVPGSVFINVQSHRKSTTKVFLSNYSSSTTASMNETVTTETLRTSLLPSTVTSPYWTAKPKIRYGLQKYFHPTMSAAQKQGMLDLLKVFKSQMEKYNIIYFLYAGSLIGAHRHHGMIPWDDDIDILIDSSQKDILKEALIELNETHALTDYDGEDTWKWKFYKLDGQPYKHKPFRYPYLDLFFFKNYNKSMFYVEVDNSWIFKRHIFPLVDKEFEGISLPTPCNTNRYLEYNYGNLGMCISPSWNHSTEYGVPDSLKKTVKCKDLKRLFRFVKRKMKKLVDKIFVTETLWENTKVIQTVSYFLPLFCTETYSRYNSKLRVRKTAVKKSGFR